MVAINHEKKENRQNQPPAAAGRLDEADLRVGFVQLVSIIQKLDLRGGDAPVRERGQFWFGLVN